MKKLPTLVFATFLTLTLNVGILNQDETWIGVVEEQREIIQQLPKEEPRLSYRERLEQMASRGEIRVLNMEITAYTDDEECQEEWVGETATGVKPQVGVVAVDPRVIPLGTRIYVDGYGEAIAGDTGGAIKGNRIDVFMPTSKECNEWGRQKRKVFILY